MKQTTWLASVPEERLAELADRCERGEPLFRESDRDWRDDYQMEEEDE